MNNWIHPTHSWKEMFYHSELKLIQKRENTWYIPVSCSGRYNLCFRWNKNLTIKKLRFCCYILAVIFLNKCLSFHFPLKWLLKMSGNIASFANGDFRNHKMIKRQVLLQKSMPTFCYLDNQNLQTLLIVVVPMKAPLATWNVHSVLQCLHERPKRRRKYVRGLFGVYNIFWIEQHSP